MMTPVMPLPLVRKEARPRGRLAVQPGRGLMPSSAINSAWLGAAVAKSAALSARSGKDGAWVSSLIFGLPYRPLSRGSRMTLAMSDSRLATSTAVVSSSNWPWMKE
ncbi:hypothetical protein D3C85_1667410 [compost metagenome]